MLKVLYLGRNRLTGTIPTGLFNAQDMEILMLQSNSITGTIPTEVGMLNAVREVSFSHNLLKGNIPSNFAAMENLVLLHLHNNRLFGVAPEIHHLESEGSINSFITDCGDPSFLISTPLVCKSCTICCNSLNQCQKNVESTIPVEVTGYVICSTLLPLIITALLYILQYIQNRGFLLFLQEGRRSLSIYNEDSVYCLIFSSNRLAWLIYILTGTIQALILYMFLKSSNFHDSETDWKYTMRCPANSLTCDDEAFRPWYGWALFFVVTILFLGSDFIDSFLQLRKAVAMANLRFFLSGLILFFLTMLALYTSFLYNVALAESSTELIMNAVILLFINDLDEQLLNVLDSVAPYWIASRYVEIEMNLQECSKNHESEIETPPRFTSSRFAGIRDLSSFKEQHASRHTSGLRMLGILGSSKMLDLNSETEA